MGVIGTPEFNYLHGWVNTFGNIVYLIIYFRWPHIYSLHSHLMLCLSQSRNKRLIISIFAWLFVLLPCVMSCWSLQQSLFQQTHFQNFGWIHLTLNETAGAEDIILCVKGMRGKSESHSPDYPDILQMKEVKVHKWSAADTSLLCVERGLCGRLLSIQHTSSQSVSHTTLEDSYLIVWRET